MDQYKLAKFIDCDACESKLDVFNLHCHHEIKIPTTLHMHLVSNWGPTIFKNF